MPATNFDKLALKDAVTVSTVSAGATIDATTFNGLVNALKTVGVIK